jgi:Repeat of unknown function (DUF5648)
MSPGAQSPVATPMGPWRTRLLAAMLIAAHAPAVTAQTFAVVEFYHAGRDHYFSALPPDIAALDSGRVPGWVRTGQMFNAYAKPGGNADPVCRFHIPPPEGDSHFYSASAQECADVASKHRSFVLESPDAMYVDLPDLATGACPQGDLPVYRLFDQRTDINHRYTTDPSTRTAMVAAGWIAEGYGPDRVIMCTPPPPTGNCPPQGALTVVQSMTLADDCTIRGDLVVKNDAMLDVDYSRKAGARFVVQGDVTVEGSATLWIHGSAGAEAVFVVDNQFSQHRTMISKDDAKIRWEHVRFETQADIDPGMGSVYMSYAAMDRSGMVVDDGKIIAERAWLLANFGDATSLHVTNTEHLPNEIYIRDAATVRLGGTRTRPGLWLDAGGARGTLTLPDVTMPYAWKAGKTSGLDVGWTLEVDHAQPGLGVEIHPGTSLTINGKGGHAPATGELKIAYFVAGETAALQGLKAGVQNAMISDRLTLNNVQLGPIAWQVYAGDDARLTIKDSTINEIGIFGKNAAVVVDRCVLQLAVLAALGPGSRLAIGNSDSWNQSIEAASDARVTITGSNIYGSLLNARDAASAIGISGGAFHANPAGCTQDTMVNISTGQPQCNPFRPPGFPQRTGAGKITCVATAGCTF